MNNYVEPMISDKKGNIYISMKEYHKDVDRIKRGLQEVRQSLKDSKKTMKKLYNRRKKEKEGIKALGYIECIDYLDKYLYELLRSNYGDSATKEKE